MEPTRQDESEIRGVLEDYMQLWMDGDARACADLYDVDGDALGVDGTFLRGRGAIREHYEAVMSGTYSGFVVRELETTGLRALGPGWALLDARWEVGTSAGDEAATPVKASLVMTHTDGAWKIAAARMMVPAQIGS